MKKIKFAIPVVATLFVYPLVSITSCGAMPEPDVKPWYLDNNYLNSLKEEDITKDDGVVQTIEVNGQPHKVRLIGVDHDKLSDGSGKAHTTWEFANLFSDKNGYSMATPFNWEGVLVDSKPTNFNFSTSNLRKALDGQGVGSIHWYLKGESVETQDPTYKNKSVLDMLPEDLKGVLKEVVKPFAIYSVSTTGEGEYIMNPNDYKTKLFTLSYFERLRKGIGSEALPEGKTYKYYYGREIEENVWNKAQVIGNKDALQTSVPITDKKWTDDDPQNFVGIDFSTPIWTSGGGWYWMRSPRVDKGNSGSYVWFSTPAGEEMSDMDSVYDWVMPVVPAFCI